jgi:hypothetical protein
MKEEKNSIGKTVWMEKEVIEMVKEYRKAQKEIPTFSHAVNTLLKKALGHPNQKQKPKSF